MTLSDAENTATTSGQQNVDSAPPEQPKYQEQSNNELLAAKAMLTKRTEKLDAFNSELSSIASEFGIENGFDGIKAELQKIHGTKSEHEKTMIELKHEREKNAKLNEVIQTDRVNRALLELGPIAGQSELRLILQNELDLSKDDLVTKTGKKWKDAIPEYKKRFPFWMPATSQPGTDSKQSNKSQSTGQSQTLASAGDIYMQAAMKAQK